MQKLQLSIPEPCHENWQQMTPTDQGRFCNACAKEVVDFSMMTDTEVLNYFTTLTHEKVCGRALPSQLERTITWPKEPKKRLFWYWNYIVMFFMFFTKANMVKAQGGIRQLTVLNPVKTNDIRGDVTMVVVKEESRVITGKVTDIEGTPVSFAAIKIKGTSNGVSADANGAYSIRVNHNDILFISGISFKSVEVAVGSEKVINTALEKIPGCELKAIVLGGMLGSISYRNVDSDYSAPDKTRYVAILKVKDEETGKYLPNASVVINSNSFIDTVITDAKGIYKIKGIEKFDNFYIKVKADGYESNEFTISEADFKDRKKEWEVLLRKHKVEPAKSNVAKLGEPVIRFRDIISKDTLYIVDGIILPNIDDIKPDDVDDYSVLQAPEAIALFGHDGSNGAIVITTRKSKEKSLKEVVVVSEFGIKRTARSSFCGGNTICGVNLISINDSNKTSITNPINSFKIFPNPVQRGEQFNIALKLKQTGLYQIQITNAAGSIVLQKQFNALAKELTEKIQVDNRWSSGAYYISIIDNKNQLISKKSFIVR